MTSGAVTASAAGLRLPAHHDLGGYGDAVQVIRHRDAVYAGHLGPSGMGSSVLDVADPAQPKLVTQWPAPPHSHTHKVQAGDALLLAVLEPEPALAALMAEARI